jgi:integrase
MNYDIPEYAGPFGTQIREYIGFKRSLGYDYGKPILYRLRELDLFFKDCGVTEVAITEEMFERWAVRRPGETTENQRRRALVLIAFSNHLRRRGFENIHVGEIPGHYQRRQPVPYIFTEHEISEVFKAAHADVCGNPGDRDRATFEAMLALYYGCGLRKSEVQALKMTDVDFDSGRIQILDSKNHLSRIVVSSDSVRRRLDGYCAKFCMGRDTDSPVFRSEGSVGFSDYRLYKHYHRALSRAGIQPRENGRLPRIHDLRHTFCVHTLEAMSKKGFDLYVSLPLLVKYLGHNCISETEYYLRLVGENFTLVTKKSKAYVPSLFPKVGDADGE